MNGWIWQGVLLLLFFFKKALCGSEQVCGCLYLHVFPSFWAPRINICLLLPHPHWSQLLSTQQILQTAVLHVPRTFLLMTGAQGQLKALGVIEEKWFSSVSHFFLLASQVTVLLLVCPELAHVIVSQPCIWWATPSCRHTGGLQGSSELPGKRCMWPVLLG